MAGSDLCTRLGLFDISSRDLGVIRFVNRESPRDEGLMG
jgi:hypothetical protein